MTFKLIHIMMEVAKEWTILIPFHLLWELHMHNIDQADLLLYMVAA